MKKTDLIEVISNQSKISRSESKLCVKVILAELTSAIASGKVLKCVALAVSIKDIEKVE